MVWNQDTYKYIKIAITFKFNVGQRSLFLSPKWQDISEIVPDLLSLKENSREKKGVMAQHKIFYGGIKLAFFNVISLSKTFNICFIFDTCAVFLVFSKNWKLTTLSLIFYSFSHILIL